MPVTKKAIVEVEESAEKSLIELATIMRELRWNMKIWQTHFGSTNRNNMKRWEEKADQWLSKHIKIFDE